MLDTSAHRVASAEHACTLTRNSWPDGKAGRRTIVRQGGQRGVLHGGSWYHGGAAAALSWSGSCRAGHPATGHRRRHRVAVLLQLHWQAAVLLCSLRSAEMLSLSIGIVQLKIWLSPRHTAA